MKHYSIFKNATLILLAIACVCLHLLTAGAQTLPVPLQILPLPLPPGERSVSRLLQAPDGNVYGIAKAADNRWRLVRIASDAAVSVTVVDKVPGLTLPPANLVDAGSHAWQWDFARRRGYLLAANGHLMSYGVDGVTSDLGQVSGTRPFEEKTGFQLSRTLLLTATGDVYTAGENGAIFRYSPGAETVVKLEARLPAIIGREPWASLDAAVTTPSGVLYGGTYDGYLFSFDTKTSTVTNFGKPFRAQRISALVVRDGLIYGLGGSEDDLPRFFTFNPETRGFTLGGLFTHGITPRILNYYEPVGACASDIRGNTYFSTTGRLGEIFHWKASAPASAATTAPQ